MAYTPTSLIEQQRRMAQQLAQSPSKPDTLGQVLKALQGYGAYRGMKSANEATKTNQKIQTDEMQQMIRALQGEPALGMMKPGEMPSFQSPDVSNLAAQLQIKEATKEPEAYTLGQGDQRFVGGELVASNTKPAKPDIREINGQMVDFTDPQNPQVVFGERDKPLSVEEFNHLQSLPDDQQPAYSDFVRRGSTTVNVGRDESAYLKGRGEAQAESFAELERAADSAYKSNLALERFMENSAQGTAGGAEPVITGVQNLLSTFGYSSESLNSVTAMDQAISEILANKMSELGARGLTDRDMDTLRSALPRVATSPEARIDIAKVLMESNRHTLRQYQNAVQQESQMHPDRKFIRPSWYENIESLTREPPSDDVVEGILRQSGY